jgi:luciferase family oxidoreductase group 1
MLTASALRRDARTTGDDLPAMLDELYGFFRGSFGKDHAYHSIRAVPALGNEPPVWLLGSSGYSARLAGRLGLPFAFAHHFSQENTLPALKLYRDTFRPSAALAEPEAMIGVIAIVAETDAEAQRLALPTALAFLRLRQGRRDVNPTIEEALRYPWTSEERAFAEKWLAQNVVGSPASVRKQLDDLLEATRADELMVLCTVPEAEARKRSYTMLREIHG